MIDLHLHTTASDGRATPRELVQLAADAGITAMAVTDHDTMAAVEETRALARAAGITFLTGIEITAVWDGLDVHVLGYGLDPRSASLNAFLDAQRADRVRRLREMAARLGELGVPVNLGDLLRAAAADPQAVVGRPQIARALVRAGHVADVREAFDRYLGEQRPAFVPRHAPVPADIVRRVAAEGGLSSIAHPGLLARDEILEDLARAGLDALEAYHPNHDEAATARYLELAGRLGLAVTGGSDFHADSSYGGLVLGAVPLPPEQFNRFVHRLERKRNTG